MPPDHDHFSGRVNLDDVEPVMRELASPIPAWLTADPGSELNVALAPYHPAEQARGTT